MDVLFVEVVGRDGVGNGVGGHVYGFFVRKAQHVFGIDFDGVVSEFVLGDGLETLRALGEVGIALDPMKGVEMYAGASTVFVLNSADPRLLIQIESVEFGPGFHKGPVEKVAVIGDDNLRFPPLVLGKESFQQCLLIGFVEDGKGSGVVGLRCVFKVVHVGGDDGTRRDEEPLSTLWSTDHVGNHKDFVHIGGGELERSLGAFNIKGEKGWIGLGLAVGIAQADAAKVVLRIVEQVDVVPGSRPDVQVRTGADDVGDVILAHVDEEREGVLQVGLIVVWLKGWSRGLSCLVLVDDIAYDFPELHELLYAVADHFEDLASVGVLVFGCEMVGLVEIGLGDDVASVESGFSESRERGLQEFEDNRDVFRSDSGKIRQHVKVGSIENGGLEGMSRIGGKVEIETGTFGTSHGSRRYVLGDRYLKNKRSVGEGTQSVTSEKGKTPMGRSKRVYMYIYMYLCVPCCFAKSRTNDRHLRKWEEC